MKKQKSNKKTITIAIDNDVNIQLDEKSINKSKLINTLLKNSPKEEYPNWQAVLKYLL